MYRNCLYSIGMSNERSPKRDTGPRHLIEADGRPLQAIASAAGISYETVWTAKNTNTWPRQYRTRTGLRAALGLVEPVRSCP